MLILSANQSELEHRMSKARFPRTSGRSFTSQLSKIERRQRLIRRMREDMNDAPGKMDTENLDKDTHVPYNIGKTQNSPVHIPTFLQKNDGDPAIKVRRFLKHSGCRVLTEFSVELLHQVKGISSSPHPGVTPTSNPVSG